MDYPLTYAVIMTVLRRYRCLTSCLLLPGSLLLSMGARAEEALTYNRDIRPILSKNCFTCHGPDSAARKADLRLDDPEVALSSKAIIPGDTSASELVSRILTEDPDDLMPPPASKLALTATQKETLQQWIREGAVYEKHWAFIPPVAPEGAPTIDTLVQEKLRGLGLESSPEAPRETLIRRVAFDLIGLPPTLPEIDAFLADTTPTAYETMVDQYLDRPAYGEHLAGQWLDVARYADTYGYQNDRESTVWPWRDWVITAFNENMPYDQFVREQIAGDLLPDPTQDQRLATTFNRLHRQTNEGGSVLEEFRVAYVSDRAETTATAFLGLTMNCAKCHDHKFDPISQQNYYELSAFFNSVDESGMYSHFTNVVPSPSMFLYRDDQAEKHQALKAAILQAEQAENKALSDATARFSTWAADPMRALPLPTPVVDLSFDTVVEGTTPDGAADRSATLSGSPESIGGPEGQALQFNGDNGVELKDAAAGFERHQPVTFALWLRRTAEAPRNVIFHRSKAAEDAASRGYELLLTDGKPDFALCHFWPGNAIRVQAREAIPLNTWTHCAITYDGSSRADGLALYLNGKQVDVDIIRDGLTKTILYEGEADTAVQLAMRFRDNGFKGGQLDEFKLFGRRLSALEVESLAGTVNLVATIDQQATAPADAQLQEFFVRAVDTVCSEQRDRVLAARKEEVDFVNGLQSIMVMEDMPDTRTAYILERGEYNHHGKPVEPNAPEHILPLPEDVPRNRLSLAAWLVNPQNPLTARVEVNRLWQLCFGVGIVKTQEDFGTQGSLPSNQVLLDYLATRFVNSGWNVKALLREIVLSSTYRQDATASPELRERDPENRLLARGPKGRMSAEEIRDNALASSGLLVQKLGGPSVKPYQPDGLWKEASGLVYTPDTGEGLYRRSIYTFIKRTVPPPSMLNFNATSREVCLARRETTVTPMQALVLLNDPQYVEAARALAVATLPTVVDGSGDWIDAVFRHLTSRKPDDDERRILQEALHAQQEEFESDPAAAQAFLSIGEQPIPEGVDPVGLAAATALTQAIMNFEEFQVKQ